MLLNNLFAALRRLSGSERHTICADRSAMIGCAGTRISFFASAIFFGALPFAAPASALVLDISPQGVVTAYDGPSIFRSEGVRPIAAVHPAARRAVPYKAVPAPDVAGLLARAASRYAVRADLLTAVAWRESHFHADAVSPKGAFGVMQLMPETARDLGVDRYDPTQNILGGAAYLRRMMDRYNGNEALALAAYNAGPGAVDRYRGIPQFAETQNYVGAILGEPPARFGLSSAILFDR